MKSRPRFHLAQTPERPRKGPRFVEAKASICHRRKRRVGIWSQLLGELTAPIAEDTGPPG
jgi:hypothetical protein